MVSRINYRRQGVWACRWRGGGVLGKGVGGVVKTLLQPANFTLGPDATLYTERHKNSVRIKAPNSANASKRKHQNQIKHYDKHRQYSWLILLCARVNENTVESFLFFFFCFFFPHNSTKHEICSANKYLNAILYNHVTLSSAELRLIF